MGQIGTAAMLAVLAGACSDHSAGAVNRPSDEREQKMTQNGDDRGPARQLPFAHGRSFATLDDYLAHLRDYAGPVGQPWYRKVGADTYELVTTATPRGEPQIFTRAQLLERFGFSR